MFAKLLIILLSINFGLAITSVAQTPDPSATVRAFYSFDKTAPQVFNKRNLNRRKGWMSDRLYRLFEAELRKQRVFLASNPTDKPFFGDGFPFQPSDETCDVNGRSLRRRHSVRASGRVSAARVQVPVTFWYPKPCTVDAITFKVVAVRSGAKWLIDDIIYDDGRTLSDSMKNHRY
jgi:hypothetical protein